MWKTDDDDDDDDDDIDQMYLSDVMIEFKIFRRKSMVRTEVTMTIYILWDVRPCSLVDHYPVT
jgi:hypothetical protein